MTQKAAVQKKENVWNAILNEQSNNKPFQNKNVLVLGRKNSGKRSLIDGLTEISKTQYPKKNPQDQMAGKMKVKGSASLLDYSYLNVVDLQDPDNVTNARLNIYMFEEDFQTNLINQVLNEKQIQQTMVVITLDFQEPWTFMDDLNRWMEILNEQFQKVKVSYNTLEEMKQKIENYIRNFKEQDDRDPESQARLDDEQVEKKLPLREGVLKTNIGLPIIIVVTKSDIIEQAEKEKDWDSKFEVILYSLRQFCITFGATLIFTSQKQNTNLNIFYEYILHRLYDCPLKHKSDTSNGESFFVPIGIEDASILKSLYTNFTVDLPYETKVPVPQTKKNLREELIAEDNQELFKMLKEKQGTSGTSKPGLSISLNSSQQEKHEEQSPSIQGILTPAGKKQEELNSFYKKLLPSSQAKPDQNQLQESAKLELFNRMKSTKQDTLKPKIFNADDAPKIQSIVNKFYNAQDTKSQNDNVVQNILNQSKKTETDDKIKNLLSLSKQSDSQK